MLKAISIVKPTWVCIENVTGAATLALEKVASDLESLNYEVGPLLEIPACAVGLDHWRPRYWILGYSYSNVQPVRAVHAEMAKLKRVRRRARNTRVPNGIPARVDRRRAIGNAIVPQIAEALGRMILEASR